MSTRRRPGTFTVVKDVSSYLGGWLLIGHQAVAVPPADFNLWLLLVGGALVGVPGISQLVAMRTAIGQSPSAPPESPPPSPPSSTASAAER